MHKLLSGKIINSSILFFKEPLYLLYFDFVDWDIKNFGVKPNFYFAVSFLFPISPSSSYDKSFTLSYYRYDKLQCLLKAFAIVTLKYIDLNASNNLLFAAFW